MSDHDFEIHFIHEAYIPSHLDPKPSDHGKGARAARMWYNAAFNELIASDFLTKPKLCTVQTIAMLTILHRNFGEANRDYYLLGVAINISRTLGMDRLGSEVRLPPNLSTRPEWQTRAERELGRRLWWTLVICDWQVHSSDLWILFLIHAQDDRFFSPIFNTRRFFCNNHVSRSG